MIAAHQFSHARNRFVPVSYIDSIKLLKTFEGRAPNGAGQTFQSALDHSVLGPGRMESLAESARLLQQFVCEIPTSVNSAAAKVPGGSSLCLPGERGSH